MGRKRGNTYGDIVRKAVLFMQANLGRTVAVPEIAQAVFYSPGQLRRAFRHITGRSVLVYLLELRLERARQMLRDTDLDITEVGLNTGFNDLSYFSAAFKRLAGMSPSRFRAASREMGTANPDPAHAESSAEVFRDPLSGTLSEMWLRRTGEWRCEAGYIEGLANEICQLVCMRRLPENFRVSFESQFVLSTQFIPSDLIIKILNEALDSTYVQITIGAYGNSMGKMERTGMSVTCNAQAIIKPGVWQRTEIELNEDTLKILLDGREAFSYRDPFPGGYSSRCRISVGSWKSIVQFRNFAISDLGIQPLVWAVRQGDALFNEGLYGSARKFYLHLLESRTPGSNSMELHYKTGMCFLREGALAQAGEWFQKVMTRPESDFWSLAARLAEAEAAWETGNREAFQENIKALSAAPIFRDGLRELFVRIRSDLSSRGFHREACRICEMHAAMETEESLRVHPQLSLVEALSNLRCYAEAEALIRRKAQLEGLSQEMKTQCLLRLTELCSRQGKWRESDELVEEIELLTQDQPLLARCEVYRANNLRSQERFGEALMLLDNLPIRIPHAPHSAAAFAQLTASLTFCAINDPNGARRAIGRAREINPGSSSLLPGSVCQYEYPPDLLEGNFQKAADCLFRGGQAWRGLSSAWFLIEAGICYELAGNAEMSHQVYAKVLENYPSDRYCFYAILAGALRCGVYETALQMPYAVQIRSEIFCLLGLLCEAKAQKDRAVAFFRQSLVEDQTLSWPAALSKRKLAAQG